ncbi:uncharacterized protein TRIREDRAFT_109181 [Trichoderma reesei QM6a]|uniref:Predicted protein n=1 Tax=Hypocrea jecorina (strain QM6a) TaxID=431241 RepID=G0RNI0_HYPJQ|nr:uncharacterized protein TRIREDRAFT_109181 [Trichoderma reesei QM6a]EGR47255.1 predicted protein [Trichoderma reesei QM6a]
MPQSSRESRFSTRDGDDARRDHSRHEERSRHHRDKRSLSPNGSPQRHSSDRRKRTASPRDSDRDRDREREHKKRRSAEGHHHHHHHRHHHHHSSSSRTEKPWAAELPFGARHLSKDDLKAFEPLFGEYLSLQKQRDIAGMDEREIRGRWKSFVGKWNRGELAEGWYDPEMFQRILARHPTTEGQREREERQQQQQKQYSSRDVSVEDDRYNSGGDDSEDEDYGPVLPGASGGSRRVGVGIPNKEDLALRDELVEESREADREGLRAARKADRKLQKERLEELVPRAEAGTRERKLEKRQEVNDKMRQFREKSPGGEVRDSELMGGGDSLEEYKKAKEREQRRKSEREIRREEMERARREEIEAKRRAWQEKEDRTVSMLRELARQRFGGV